MKSNNDKNKTTTNPTFTKLYEVNDFLRPYKITAFNSPAQKAIDFINNRTNEMVTSMRPKIIREVTEEDLEGVIEKTGQVK